MNSLPSEQLSLAIAKANKMASTLPLSVAAHLQRILGEEFEVSTTGLSIVPGSSLSPEVYSEKIAFLAGASDQGRVATGLINLALGDLIIAARKDHGDDTADNLIQQAVNVRGQAKHTVQEAERTVKFINEIYPDHNSRPEGLTFTHFAELRRVKAIDGRWLIEGGEERFKEIIQEVEKGHLVSNVVTGEGEEKPTYQPKSTKETRQLVNDALPAPVKPPKASKQLIGQVEQSTPPAPIKSEEKPIRFIYIDKDDHTDVVYSTEEYLDDDLLSDQYIILDVWCKEVLNPEKEAIAAFTEI